MNIIKSYYKFLENRQAEEAPIESSPESPSRKIDDTPGQSSNNEDEIPSKRRDSNKQDETKVVATIPNWKVY